MTGAPRPDVTPLLKRAWAGDELARGDLISQVYAELRRVAAGLMRREHPGHTLSPTAAVHEALDRLAGLHQRQSQVVTLYFGRMTVPEVAAALEVSVGTVERDWRIARAWRSNELGGEGVG
jgi:DNA-directed RNA polymerase specialized sigma24 family protein